MLELRLRHLELSVIENPSHYIYRKSLIKQIQRIIKSSYTTCFSSISSFEILHRLIKSFVIQTPNKVFGSSKRHFLKSDLKNLKSEQLQTIRNQWLRRKVKDTKFIILQILATIKK